MYGCYVFSISVLALLIPAIYQAIVTGDDSGLVLLLRVGFAGALFFGLAEGARQENFTQPRSKSTQMERIVRLESISYPSEDKQGDEARNSHPCPICLEDVKTGDQVSYASPCRHCFHHSCLIEWVKREHTCPCCRQDLSIVVEKGAPEPQKACYTSQRTDDDDSEDRFDWNALAYIGIDDDDF